MAVDGGDMWVGGSKGNGNVWWRENGRVLYMSWSSDYGRCIDGFVSASITSYHRGKEDGCKFWWST